jgi:NADP-dependent 3-hydroxy acid dehydrogenase YdfG
MILKKKKKKIGRKSIATTADVFNDKSIETMMKNAAKEFSSLDVCIILFSVYSIFFFNEQYRL